MAGKNSVLTRILLFYGCRVPNHRGKWWIINKIRHIFKIEIDEELQVTRRGLEWNLNPSDYVQSELFWFGAEDMWNTYHLRKLLKPDSIVLDIGSNFGYYAITITNFLKGKCKVYAFEPNLPTYERLQKNIALNGLSSSINAYCLGMSNSEGKAYICESPGNTGAARIATEGDREVSLITLDKFCQEHSIDRIDFIKIDVEGFEEKALNGGLETLARLKPIIIIELNPPTLRRVGSTPKTVVSILEDTGYRCFEVRRKKLVPLEKVPDGEDYIDVFCLPSNVALKK